MKPPFPVLHKDVVLGPLLPGSNKHRFLFETFPAGLDVPHYRKDRIDVTTRSEMAAAVAQSAERIDDPTIYAGPYIDHFGHFVAECVHRLYARKAFPELSRAKVAFHVGGRRPFAPAQWAVDVMRLFALTCDDVIAIDRPLRFSALYVPLQGRTLGGPSLVPGYPSLLPIAPHALTPPADPDEILYLSRSRHFYSGSYLGETHVERLLAQAGVAIVHPEAVPTEELVARLRTAKVAIFSEGSAIHNLELCGPCGLRVFVIGRRGGAADRLGAMLDDFAAEWRAFDPALGGVPLDWDVVRAQPSWQRNNAYPRLGALIRALSDFIGRPMREPTHDEAFEAMSADLVRYVLDPRSTRSSTSNERLGELLRMLRGRHMEVGKRWAALQEGTRVKVRRKAAAAPQDSNDDDRGGDDG